MPLANVEVWPIVGACEPGQGFTSGGAQAFGQNDAVRLWPIGGAPFAWPVAGPFQVLPGA